MEETGAEAGGLLEGFVVFCLLCLERQQEVLFWDGRGDQEIGLGHVRFEILVIQVKILRQLVYICSD